MSTGASPVFYDMPTEHDHDSAFVAGGYSNSVDDGDEVAGDEHVGKRVQERRERSVCARR